MSRQARSSHRLQFGAGWRLDGAWNLFIGRQSPGLSWAPCFNRTKIVGQRSFAWARCQKAEATRLCSPSCLGLLGQAALSVRRRTKEIGIRKVLGATLHDIVLLISREFAALVTIGIVVAAPTAYLAMQRRLEDFAYRIPLSGWMFLAAGCAALVIALMTAGYHAVRSALADPVKSLRYE